MRRLLAVCAREGIRTRALATSHAFHSALMDPMLDAYEGAVRDVAWSKPDVTIISNLSGRVDDGAMLRSGYWRRQIPRGSTLLGIDRGRVGDGARLFVEIGPNPVLVGLGARTAGAGGAWLPSLRDKHDDWQELLGSVAMLYERGVTIDWHGVSGGQRRRPIALPTYPFERQRYWISKPTPGPSAAAMSSDERWSRVADATERQSRMMPVDLVIDSYAAKWTMLDRLARAYVSTALTSLGVLRASGERATVTELRDRCGVLPIYEGLLQRWLDTLVRIGIVGA